MVSGDVFSRSGQLSLIVGSLNFFGLPIFLKKKSGILYFMMMKSKQVNQTEYDSIDEIIPASLNIYAFDGEKVIRSTAHQHNFEFRSFINELYSNSWMFENIHQNSNNFRGSEQSNGLDVIIPRDSKGDIIYKHAFQEEKNDDEICLFSVTSDWKIAKFKFQITK